MNFEGEGKPLFYANQHEAERRVNELRGTLGQVVDDLARLAVETDSLKLHAYVADLRREFSGYGAAS